MAADITDLLTPVALATKTELATPFNDGDLSMICDDLSAWAAIAAGSALYYAVDRVQTNSDGELVRIAGTYTEWKGIVSGNTIGSLSRISGNAQDYPAGSGARVVMIITSAWANAIIAALLQTLNRDGTLKSTIVGTANIANAAVTAAKIQSEAVTFTKLLTTLFGDQVTTYTNSGSAGGTFHYIDLLGIKLLWGITNTVSITGSGQQASAPVGITLPVGFFTSFQAVFPAPGTAASGTVALGASVQASSLSAIAVTLVQSFGTNGSSGISLIVLGV